MCRWNSIFQKNLKYRKRKLAKARLAFTWQDQSRWREMSPKLVCLDLDGEPFIRNYLSNPLLWPSNRRYALSACASNPFDQRMKLRAASREEIVKE